MMKRWFLVFSGGVMMMCAWGGLLVWNGWRMTESILNNQPNDFRRYYDRVMMLGGKFVPFMNRLPERTDDKTYIVLLQNNTELRPSGGFMGSYVKVKFKNNGLTEMSVKDIYEPDGQLVGHVEPPLPIQEAFGQGWWKLRDANWDIDFTKAGPTIAWFFEQGKEKPVDGVIAVNLELIKKWIQLVGGVKPVTVEENLNEDNIYSIAQAKAEVGWYPGSHQKRDFLGATGVALVEKTKDTNLIKKLAIIKLFVDQLNQKQILVWMKTTETEKEIERRGWAGSLEQPGDDQDYLYIVETNLGANKANCCIKRDLSYTMNNNNVGLLIKWKNENKVSTPDKINNWGGDYYNYVRVVIRKDSEVNSIKVGDRDLRPALPADSFETDKNATPSSLVKERNMNVYRVEERGELKIIGFWVITKARENGKAEISYTQHVRPGKRIGKVFIKRQPGIESVNFRIVRNNNIKFNDIIRTDTMIDL